MEIVTKTIKQCVLDKHELWLCIDALEHRADDMKDEINYGTLDDTDAEVYEEEIADMTKLATAMRSIVSE